MRLHWMITASALLALIRQVNGHGRLVEPPSRATAWRYGFDTPANYNDHELYCGGYSRQHQRNGGRCGACGDAWDLPSPRPHENGGTYGKGVIVQSYRTGSDIDIGVELTANHRGYFEFRLCPLNNQVTPETDQCFDRYVLKRSDGDGVRYYPSQGSGIVFRPRYKLPAGLQCTRCVLQWRYVAGNNWGTCSNGTGSVGCGSQEEFRSCSDIRISKSESPTAFYTTKKPSVTTKKPNVTRAPPVYQQVHRPTTTASPLAETSTSPPSVGHPTATTPSILANMPSGGVKAKLKYLLKSLLKRILRNLVDSAYHSVTKYLT